MYFRKNAVIERFVMLGKAESLVESCKYDSRKGRDHFSNALASLFHPIQYLFLNLGVLFHGTTIPQLRAGEVKEDTGLANNLTAATCGFPDGLNLSGTRTP